MGPEDQAQKELTYGEKAVGLNFNPSGENIVDAIKKNVAIIIDALDTCRSDTEDPEQKRLASIAITELQGAQMWAVKAVTWGIK